ncbi:MAG: pantoate--beta-alanine ligase [Nocardioidaceae bacterium]
MTMLVARTRDELDTALKPFRTDQAGIGFVPTMGALHAGHAALMRAAREPASALVASIFVNPLQFGPDEDFSRYPRPFETDLELCSAEGVDVVFAPPYDVVYPTGDPAVTVDPGPSADDLEGVSRPGHFRGVLTVVAKLFGLVRPDLAVFGQKDYQQLALIEAMTRDLSMAIEIVGIPHVREPDGLALSSRNTYLAAHEREQALALVAALRAGAEVGSAGPDAVRRVGRAVLEAAVGVDLDYFEVRATDLGPAPESGIGRMLTAAQVGATRLIDNMAVQLGMHNGEE